MDKIREILSNATMAHSNMDININAKEVVNSIFKIIKENIENIEKVNKIDVKNKNGFNLDFKMLDKIEKSLECTEDMYRKVINLNKNGNNYLQGKQTDNLGNICAIYNGNTYCFIELALKSILTHNAIIFVSEADYMKSTNELFIILIQRILEAYKIDKNLIQILYTTRIEELLSNSVSINKIIVIGNKEEQDRVKKLSTTTVISNGYDYYAIYIEDITNREFIKEILKQNKNIDVFVKQGIEVPFEDYIEVSEINEAIAQINYNTAGYSTSIFTNNPENAVQFLREVKSDNISVNSSPLINEPINLNINHFLTEKNMLYPNILKESNPQNKIEFPTARKILEQNKTQEQNKIIQEMKKENEQNNLEIEALKKQLQESQTLLEKYMNIYRKSFFSRIFGKIKKSDIEKDTKLLSSFEGK